MPMKSRTSGSTSATRPMVPATTAWTTCPTGPRSPHHSTAATTVASPSSARPSPSRRCAGSSPRALVPIRRAMPPTRWASPSQTARSIRPIPRSTGPGNLGAECLVVERLELFDERDDLADREDGRVDVRLLLLVDGRARVDVRVAMVRDYPSVTPATPVTRVTRPRVAPHPTQHRLGRMTSLSGQNGCARSKSILRGGRGGSDLDDQGDDHGPAAVGVAHPLADRAADQLLQLAGVPDPLRGGLGEGVLDQRPHLVDDGRGVGEAEGMYLR